MTSNKEDVPVSKEALNIFSSALKDAKYKDAEDNTEELETSPETTDEEISDEKSELSEFEQECIKRGWNPKGELSAKSWDRMESMKAEIARSHKQNKQLKQSQDNMREAIQKLEENAYKRAVAELQAQKNIAISKNDAIAANEIDREIQSLQPTNLRTLPPAVQDFLDRNADWYHDSSPQSIKMRIFCNQADNEIGKSKLPPEEHMALLEQTVKEQFPAYFNIEEKQQHKQSVESGSSTVFAKKKSKSYTINDLDNEQRRVLADFERLRIPGFNKEEFIKKLIDTGVKA